MRINKIELLIVLIASVITIYGLITGQFLFLFILLPLGFLFRGKKEDNDE